MTPRFLPTGYFVWIIVPVVAVLVYLILGLPHFIWSYQWKDQGRSYGDFKSRHYTRCIFIGPYGAFTTYPANGKCGWFLWRKTAL